MKVILFGGGDAGGLIITRNGVKPIPPFDPAILGQLRAISSLTHAELRLSETGQAQLATLTNRLSNLVVSQLEAIVGQIDEEFGLIYQDDGGGFTCGSTGKPPIPIPWPPSVIDIAGLIDKGTLQEDVLAIAAEAATKGASLEALLQDPANAIQEAGVEIPPYLLPRIQEWKLSEKDDLDDPVNHEVVNFLLAAAGKGHDFEELASNPLRMAETLSLELTPEAAARLASTASVGRRIRVPGADRMSPYAVAVVVVIVIVVADRERRVPVIDRSQIEKF